MARKEKRDDVFVEIEIETLGFEGVAIGRHDGKVILCKGALPGERVLVRLLKNHKKHVDAEVVELRSTSNDRRTPPCPHFGVCGGCTWQHLAEDRQSEWKRQHVIDAFERLGRIPFGEMTSLRSPEKTYGYRNKMEFSFGASAWLTREEILSGEEFTTSFALGLHVPGRFDKVRNITSCLLHADAADRILSHTHALAAEYGISAHNQRSHVGFARHLLLRSSATTGSILTALITTTPSSDAEIAFVNAWMNQATDLPEGSTLIHAVSNSRSPVAIGSIEKSVGPGYLEEVSHGVTYRISPFSFFQTNTFHLPILVGEALDGADIRAEDVVWDLYCGTGTLSLPAARRSHRVIGAELVQSSIDDARANAERNSITNVDFHTVDLHAPAAIDVLKSWQQPDVVIVDPPRNGMHPQVVAHLLSVAAPTIVYVSCNPATQARDCAVLHEAYDVVRVTPVDMFPQTWHVESVAILKRRVGQ